MVSESNWRWIKTTHFKILCLRNSPFILMPRYLRLLRIDFKLKTNLPRIKSLLFLVCCNKMTLMAFLSTAFALGEVWSPRSGWRHGCGSSASTGGQRPASECQQHAHRVISEPLNLTWSGSPRDLSGYTYEFATGLRQHSFKHQSEFCFPEQIERGLLPC